MRQKSLQLAESSPHGLSCNEQLGKIQKCLPSGLTDKVHYQGEKTEDEHRQVTIIFVHMRGLTPLTEKQGTGKAPFSAHLFSEVMLQIVPEEEATIIEEDPGISSNVVGTALLEGNVSQCLSALFKEGLHYALRNRLESSYDHSDD